MYWIFLVGNAALKLSGQEFISCYSVGNGNSASRKILRNEM